MKSKSTQKQKKQSPPSENVLKLLAERAKQQADSSKVPVLSKRQAAKSHTPSKRAATQRLQKSKPTLKQKTEVMVAPVKLMERPQPWTPEPYQLEGAQFLLENAAGGLFLDPGFRKTSITLAAIKILKDEGLLNKVLIIAPLRVCYMVWPEEIKKWVDFNHLTCTILHGPQKDKKLLEDSDIYIINPEGLEWLFGVTKTKGPNSKKSQIKYDLKKFNKLGIDTLVIDEVSKFKNSNSDRFRMLKPLLTKFSRRWGLTGSPAPNGLLDLFGIMYTIDLGRSLGQYITHYRTAYFMPMGYGGYDWAPQPGAEERIYSRISPSVFRLAEGDYLKLPRLIENVIKVELPPEVRRIYDDLEEEFITELEGNVVTAMNAGSMAIKCRQVANGGLFLPQKVDDRGSKVGGREWVNLHNAKIEAVEDLVDELNGAQALIAYDFEHDLARLQKALGKKAMVLGGTPKQSEQVKNLWNAGKLPYILGHPSAVGHGLNLQETNAHNVILHSLTYDYDTYDQLIRRLLRSGNKSERVVVHHIIAKDTVDEAIIMALRKKKRTQNALLEALRDYSKQRKAQKLAAQKRQVSKK